MKQICPWQIYFNGRLHDDPFFPFHRQLSSCPIRHGAVISPWALVNQRLARENESPWFLTPIWRQANVDSKVTSATIVRFPGSNKESLLLNNHNAWCKRWQSTTIPIKKHPHSPAKEKARSSPHTCSKRLWQNYEPCSQKGRIHA